MSKAFELTLSSVSVANLVILILIVPSLVAKTCLPAVDAPLTVVQQTTDTPRPKPPHRGSGRDVDV